MPSFFQAGSKKKRPAYVTGDTNQDENEKRKNKNPGQESKFLQQRKEEIKTHEELNKNEQKMFRKKDFVDRKTGCLVKIERLPYTSIDVRLT